MTPAYATARNGHVGTFELLRDAKVNLETPDKNGQTPAFGAACRGNVGTLEILRDAKVNLETPDKGSMTPAYAAVYYDGHSAILQLLQNSE